MLPFIHHRKILSTSICQNIDALCNQYIDLIYQDIDVSSAQHIESIAQTSGGILHLSVDKLISLLNLTEQDIFVDLGSGLGKLVLYFFLRTPVKEARGIEILQNAYQCSRQAQLRVSQELPEFFEQERKLTFLQGDFLQVPLKDVTVMFLCSVCFGQDILCAIGDLINCNANIRTVLTLRPISNLRRLPLYKVLNIECTWGAALCYIYTNRT